MISDLQKYPALKASREPWLGDIPAHWASERAKWLFTKMDRPVREHDEVVTCFRDGVVTLRKNRRLRGFTEATVYSGYQGIRQGDLVIHGMDAFAGAIGVSDSDGKGTPVYNVCQPRPGVNARYYAHLLREMSRSQWILALAKGIRERSTDFRFEMFGNQRVPLPPPDEQAAIVRFLDWANGRLERAIRAKRKVITLLGEQKQAIIHRAVTRGLDPTVPLKPSGIPWLGDIPQHWEVAAIGAAATLIQTGPFGSQLHSHEYVTAGVPVINPSHMAGGRIKPSQAVTISAEKARELSRHMLCSGDIVIARRGELGRCALVTPFEQGWICGTGSLLLRCKTSTVSPAFFQAVFASRGIADMLSLSSIGATMANLNAGTVARQRLPLPPLDEQQRIVRFIEDETHTVAIAISRLQREIELLREYRTRLVAEVVTGKLDVREAAARLPDEAPLDSVEDAADLGDEIESEAEEIEA